MESKKIIFFFPSIVFSGHEKMALRILEHAPYEVTCLLNEKLTSKFNLNNLIISYSNFFYLLMKLLKLRFQNKNISIVLIAGSPYGYLFEKILLKLLAFKIIEYVPFPELKIMQDKFHHKFIPIFNKIFISQRILIDHWQIKFSAVKNVIIIQNIV